MKEAEVKDAVIMAATLGLYAYLVGYLQSDNNFDNLDKDTLVRKLNTIREEVIKVVLIQDPTAAYKIWPNLAKTVADAASPATQNINKQNKPS